MSVCGDRQNRCPSIRSTCAPRRGELPRVLILVVTKIKADDPASLLPRMQFSRWPPEQLAQIYSGETAGAGEFCGLYHQIGPPDRWFGRLFMRLRKRVASVVAMQAPATAAMGNRPSLLGWLQRGLAGLLIHSGLWEVIFRIRISPEMDRFIREFRPEVIYCTGYHLGFAMLPVMIARRYDLPICFQTFEDWPQYTSRYSPVGVLVRKKAAELVRSAAVRLAFGPKMVRVYEQRYGVPFEVTYHLDEPARFAACVRRRCAEGEVRRIVFTGSLVLSRHEAIADVLQAVRLLRKQSESLEIGIEVYCSGVPQDLPQELRQAQEIHWLPLPAHEELPQVLAGADILLLPESFSVGEKRLGLALSTKCHLYMLAGRPILVYGPDYAGTVEYAREAGWAKVVQQRDVQALAGAINELLGAADLAQMTAAAQRCVVGNHDLTSGRERFEGWMMQATAQRSSATTRKVDA